MTHCVFYFPFGHDQTRLAEGIEYSALFLICASHFAWYPTAWRTRELLAHAPSFSYALSGECLAWLDDEAQVGPTLATEASASTSRGRRST